MSLDRISTKAVFAKPVGSYGKPPGQRLDVTAGGQAGVACFAVSTGFSFGCPDSQLDPHESIVAQTTFGNKFPGGQGLALTTTVFEVDSTGAEAEPNRSTLPDWLNAAKAEPPAESEGAAAPPTIDLSVWHSPAESEPDTNLVHPRKNSNGTTGSRGKSEGKPSPTPGTPPTLIGPHSVPVGLPPGKANPFHTPSADEEAKLSAKVAATPPSLFSPHSVPAGLPPALENPFYTPSPETKGEQNQTLHFVSRDGKTSNNSLTGAGSSAAASNKKTLEAELAKARASVESLEQTLANVRNANERAERLILAVEPTVKEAEQRLSLAQGMLHSSKKEGRVLEARQKLRAAQDKLAMAREKYRKTDSLELALKEARMKVEELQVRLGTSQSDNSEPPALRVFAG
jgi:hypothetical protein